jgi:hypothetical protein
MVEVLTQTAVYAGFPAALNAVGALSAVLAEPAGCSAAGPRDGRTRLAGQRMGAVCGHGERQLPPASRGTGPMTWRLTSVS